MFQRFKTTYDIELSPPKERAELIRSEIPEMEALAAILACVSDRMAADVKSIAFNTSSLHLVNEVPHSATDVDKPLPSAAILSCLIVREQFLDNVCCVFPDRRIMVPGTVIVGVPILSTIICVIRSHLFTCVSVSPQVSVTRNTCMTGNFCTIPPSCMTQKKSPF
jgi:hypothetical protein